jgi:hypothetical protein
MADRCFINKSELRTKKSLVDSRAKNSNFSDANQLLREYYCPTSDFQESFINHLYEYDEIWEFIEIL